MLNMLQIKDNHKLFEFRNYFASPTRAFTNLINIFGVFSIKSITKGIFGFKAKGYSYTSLLQMLILMPFLGAKNIHALFNTHYQIFYKGKKDSLYDTLRNPDINWRRLLLNFSKRFIKKVNENSNFDGLTFFIADDSDLEKRTPFFESLSRVFNHVTRNHVFGYKVLTLGYSDGKSFIPLDFSFHNEKGKKKNYGLTRKQRKEQYKKDRNPASYGAKREKEVRMKKGENLIKMIKRAVKHGIIAKYLLTDSWFLSESMISEIRKIKNGAIHILSMCRMDKRKYYCEDGEFNAKELLKRKKQNRKNIKRSKKYKVYYIEATVEYKGFKLKLFFTRLTKRSKWRLLVTTDTSLAFTKVYELYTNRWAIEVFFKECKQYLGLGKNQSRDFDAQIASTTISFIQYTILALYKRFEQYETIGGIFKGCKSDITEQIFSDRINALFLELIEILVHKLNLSIEIDEIISAIIEEINIDSKISLIFSTHADIGGRKMAA
jgi:DDE family transposase